MNSIKEHFASSPPGHLSPELCKLVRANWPDDTPPTAYHVFEILDRGEREGGLSNMCIMVLETILAQTCTRDGISEDQLEVYADDHWRKE